MNCIIPSDQLPVLFDVDTAIVGGSFAGIASAIRLAKQGKKAAVIESRTYLGRELTATLRPWLDLSGETAESVPEPIRRCLQSSEEEAAGGPVKLHPDRLKCSLEDLLFEYDIPFIYATSAVGFTQHSGAVTGLIIANKAGRQLVRCVSVVDMTETGIAASMLGEELSIYAPGATAYYARMLEFTEVQLQHLRIKEMKVPAELGIAGSRIVIRPGCRGDGHVLVEYGLELASGNDWLSDREREIQARHVGMRLAVWLIGNVPEFGDAFLAASSHELLGPFPIYGSAGPAETGAFDMQGLYGTSLRGVYCLAKGLFRSGDTSLLDAVRGAEIGERVADELLKLLENGGNDAGQSERAAFSDDRQLEYEVKIPSIARDGWVGPTHLVSELRLPVWQQADVLVVGGGTSGACASITAAQEGMNTLLLDLNPGLGGTGTLGGVDSYWFGRRNGYAARISEWVHDVQRDLQYKGNKWNIEAKMYALLREAEKAGVGLTFNAVTFGSVVSGDRVCGAVTATRWGPCAVLAGAVIDATGDGDLAVSAGAEYVYGSERDLTVMWYSLAQFKSPGRTQNNFTSMVDMSDPLDYTRAIVAGRRRGTDNHDHGIYVATRESRHIVGDVTMRLSDQLLQRGWPDTINIHFSNHDVKGVSGADWVHIGLIPPNLEIEIPYRMLLPKGLEGILVAGKAISATHDALPAIRMQSDLENLGAVAALAATAAVRGNTVPRKIDVQALQDRLAREGLFPETILTRSLSPVVYTDEELAGLADSIETEAPLYDYANMRMNQTYQGMIPFVEICSAGPRIIPHLERALDRADGVKKIRLAQALSMIGSTAGVPVLVDVLTRELEDGVLPVRTAEMMYVQLPPDHGAMPDAAYLLYSLAQTGDPAALPVWRRAAELLHPTEEDFKDTWKGIYYYIDAVCKGAERLGDRAAIPILEKLHRIPLLNSQQCLTGAQPDYFMERRAMLELAIGRALARCGSEEGYQILIAYLSDVRSLLAKSALLELNRLSGLTYGRDPEAWKAWLREQQPYRDTYPSQWRLDFEADSSTLLRKEMNSL